MSNTLHYEDCCSVNNYDENEFYDNRCDDNLDFISSSGVEYGNLFCDDYLDQPELLSSGPMLAPAMSGVKDVLSLCDLSPVVSGAQYNLSLCNLSPAMSGAQDSLSLCNLSPAMSGAQDSLSLCNLSPVMSGVQDSLLLGDLSPAVFEVQDSLSLGDLSPVMSGVQDSLLLGDLSPVVFGERDSLSLGDLSPAVFEVRDQFSLGDLSTVMSGVQDGLFLCDPEPLKSDFCSSKIELGGSTTVMWGLNINSDDAKIILGIRRKFSVDIRDSIRILFRSMLDRKALLPSGKVLCNSSWSVVSEDLFPIAVESVGPILECEYKELNIVLSELRVVDTNKSSNSGCFFRKITDEERICFIDRAKVFIHKRLYRSVRLVWLSVVRTSVANSYRRYKFIYEKYTCVGSKFDIHCTDNAAILSIKKKFSSIIRSAIHSKFVDLMKIRYKFDDGTVISRVAWFRISKKLLPIAQYEVKHILEDESKELEEVISRFRVTVDYIVYRDITSQEKCIVLSNIMKIVHSSLKNISRYAWEDVVIASAGDNYGDVPVDNAKKSEIVNKGFISKVNLCYEDDRAIFNARRKFSLAMNKCITSKFREMFKEGYEFEDHTFICKTPWKKISKRLLPIAQKEVDVILQEEYVEINNMLLNSRVVFSNDDGVISERNITPVEISIFMRSTMKLVLKQMVSNFSVAWNRVIRSLK
ncbi:MULTISPECIES: hypothetical protein [Candidatus Ichthyocystis]|uniref:Uncharacterized protein n=1 Tax=Candidatus Ichthyocystis hellenicum TaxID=1561003 RepID=A0A0S4M338_9BURK|nr:MULTISPECIES: hypothetical protein [Ichthyocystis]CUT17691.1 hypothetical protein Ark11_0868 [Candidatus Ichthyocystis hellenicum]